ncbi:tripartite motif-containing protein 2-like [Ptychodera flava]|uniref:tripartite motif-containing protein 2-like n=1 Tax=Ptychodera flava TaxID=63121 RepID=UPI00396A6227
MAAASECKVLEEIGEDFLCCTICLEQFKSPKILPCLHTFCEQCLVTLVEKTGSLNCPECRQQYQLPVGGVPAIKDNFFMNNLVDIFKQRLESMQEAEVKCEGCQQIAATHRDGTHRVTVTGQLDGKYQVTMTIGDQPIPGCPVIIPVIKGLVKTIGSKGSAEGQYNVPCDVTINKDRDIVTADTGNNRLQIITREGKVKKIVELKQFGKPFRPCDIAISSDNTHYSLDENKQVVVIDKNGHVIRCFGQNELKDPGGIGISPVDGNVYVTDYGGHCVRVYTQHGKYLKSFGLGGSGEGEFNGPLGVVIATTGMVFVADYHNQRIQVFNAHDQYLYSFDCKNGDGTMRYPIGIAIENDKYVYVSSRDPSGLLKFESSGKFVCRIDSDSDGLKEPTGIALTDDVPCRVIVTDTINHCIMVFVQ